MARAQQVQQAEVVIYDPDFEPDVRRLRQERDSILETITEHKNILKGLKEQLADCEERLFKRIEEARTPNLFNRAAGGESGEDGESDT